MPPRESPACSRWLALLLAALALACREPAPEALLVQARALGNEQQWLEVRALAKRYLCDHPDSVAGHFLLGQSFLHLPDDYTHELIVRGELQIAVRLYEDSGDLEIFDDMGEDAFLALHHQEMAQSYLRVIRRAINAGIPEEATLGQLEAALKHVDDGLTYTPDAHYLNEMKKTLQPMVEQLRAAPWRGRSRGGVPPALQPPPQATPEPQALPSDLSSPSASPPGVAPAKSGTSAAE